jgi:hypothetical protein
MIRDDTLLSAITERIFGVEQIEGAPQHICTGRANSPVIRSKFEAQGAALTILVIAPTYLWILWLDPRRYGGELIRIDEPNWILDTVCCDYTISRQAILIDAPPCEREPSFVHGKPLDPRFLGADPGKIS